MRLYVRNRCECVNPGGLPLVQAAESAACINNQLRLYIRDRCECVTPRASIKIELRVYIRKRCEVLFAAAYIKTKLHLDASPGSHTHICRVYT